MKVTLALWQLGKPELASLLPMQRVSSLLMSPAWVSSSEVFFFGDFIFFLLEIFLVNLIIIWLV